MPLAQGTKLGPYEVLSLVGAGGMGEVYRGADSALRRDRAGAEAAEADGPHRARLGCDGREAVRNAPSRERLANILRSNPGRMDSPKQQPPHHRDTGESHGNEQQRRAV